MDKKLIADIIDLRDNVLVDDAPDTPALRAKVAAVISRIPVALLEQLLPEFRKAASTFPNSKLIQHTLHKIEDRVFDNSLVQLADEMGMPASVTQPLRDVSNV